MLNITWAGLAVTVFAVTTKRKMWVGKPAGSWKYKQRGGRGPHSPQTPVNS